MSAVRGYGLNGKSLYANVAKPQTTWLQFTVASTNANGLGVTSVKSNGFVDHVFMHTSVAPGTINGFTNPNPANGYALVQFTNNFNVYLKQTWSVVPPAGATTGNTVTGNIYTIASLGTTSNAQWAAAGFPVNQGFSPAVGAAFVATATGALGGTGLVSPAGVPTIVNVSSVGDPNQTIANANVTQYAGAYMIVQFAAATAAGNTALQATAPADGSIVRLKFDHDGSSVTIDGL